MKDETQCLECAEAHQSLALAGVSAGSLSERVDDLIEVRDAHEAARNAWETLRVELTPLIVVRFGVLAPTIPGTCEAKLPTTTPFVSEEGEDLAELLYAELPQEKQEEWEAAIEEHRDRIGSLRLASGAMSTKMAGPNGQN